MNNFLLKAGFSKKLIPQLIDEYERDFGANFPVLTFPRVKELLKMVKAQGIVVGIVSSNVRKNIVQAFKRSCVTTGHRRCISDSNDASQKAKSMQTSEQTTTAVDDKDHAKSHSTDCSAAEERETTAALNKDNFDLEGLLDVFVGLDNAPSPDKGVTLGTVLATLNVTGPEVVYVGDTLKDYRHSHEDNGMTFVGVGYGFDDLVSARDEGKVERTTKVAKNPEALERILKDLLSSK